MGMAYNGLFHVILYADERKRQYVDFLKMRMVLADGDFTQYAEDTRAEIKERFLAKGVPADAIDFDRIAFKDLGGSWQDQPSG